MAARYYVMRHRAALPPLSGPSERPDDGCARGRIETILDRAGQEPRDASFAMAKRARRASVHGRLQLVSKRQHDPRRSRHLLSAEGELSPAVMSLH
jgi:hypothetical protein